MTVLRAQVVVSGKVQGVSFRESTRQTALRHSVNGWVRNLPDGRVEAIFEGAKDAVEVLLQFVRTGPPRAKVESVEIQIAEVEGEFQIFEIRHSTETF